MYYRRVVGTLGSPQISLCHELHIKYLFLKPRRPSQTEQPPTLDFNFTSMCVCASFNKFSTKGGPAVVQRVGVLIWARRSERDSLNDSQCFYTSWSTAVSRDAKSLSQGKNVSSEDDDAVCWVIPARKLLSGRSWGLSLGWLGCLSRFSKLRGFDLIKFEILLKSCFSTIKGGEIISKQKAWFNLIYYTNFNFQKTIRLLNSWT